MRNWEKALMKNDSYRIHVAQWEAEHLWDIYGISKPDELCLEDIAFTKRVLVTEGPLRKMDAHLVRKGNHGFIRVRHDIPEKGRKRFFPGSGRQPVDLPRGMLS